MSNVNTVPWRTIPMLDGKQKCASEDKKQL